MSFDIEMQAIKNDTTEGNDPLIEKESETRQSSCSLIYKLIGGISALSALSTGVVGYNLYIQQSNDDYMMHIMNHHSRQPLSDIVINEDNVRKYKKCNQINFDSVFPENDNSRPKWQFVCGSTS